MRISDWSSDVCSSDLPVLVQATGPGDLVDKREAADELAVGAIEHIEEAVAVGGGRGLDVLAPFLVVEGDHLVDAVIVPAVVRSALEVPFDAAVVRDRQSTRLNSSH